MARYIRHVRSKLFSFQNQYLMGFENVSSNNIKGTRHLYSDAVLGVDNYVRTRERIQTQFATMSEKFKSKMIEFSEPSSSNMIFTEDLKNMVHLVEKDSSDDLNLVIKMLRRFNQQNKDLRFGNFVFGPVVMRMFYYMNTPEAALEVFKDPVMDGFFDQLISYQLLMDLLFINNRFSDILDVFKIIKNKQIQDFRYPKNVVLLSMAACYKLNTKESFELAMDIWRELQTVGHIPLRRSATFAAALALNQNSPQYALEIISTVRQQNYITIRNIKMAALADLGRVDDALPILRSILLVDDPDQRKQSVTEDVIKKIKDSVDEANNKELTYTFQRIEKQLSEQGHIQKIVLDDILCSEITATTPMQPRDRRFLAASFTRQDTGPGRPRFRPGLRDLQ